MFNSLFDDSNLIIYSGNSRINSAAGLQTLRSGDSSDAISAQLTDKELLAQFKKVEKLDKEDKHLIKTFIDAFITKRQIQQLAK